jgi:hypothetical protein
MAKRTQIVCIHEGHPGHSIDPLFANSFLKAYNPEWLRPWKTGLVRFIGYGDKTTLLNHFVPELKTCINYGSDVTLIVLADVDDLKDCEELKRIYWQKAQEAGIKEDAFNKVVFAFPRNRIENWVEFLLTGKTNEGKEGPRIYDNTKVRDAGKKLAELCRNTGEMGEVFPQSLLWTCKNWHTLVSRMK